MTIPGTAIAVASFRALPLIPMYDLPMYVLRVKRQAFRHSACIHPVICQ